MALVSHSNLPRSVGLLTALVALTLGCTTVTPVPSGGTATPTATAGASTSSAVPASSGPAASAPVGTPSITPTSSVPAASPSPSSPVGFVADTEIFSDAFSDPASTSWGTGTEETGSIGYVDGALRIDFVEPVTSLWSWRLLGEERNVLRISGRVVLTDASGAAGWMCGASPSDLLAGVINSDGQWVLVEVVSANAEKPRSTSLDSGALPEALAGSRDHLVTFECAGTATGALRLRMLVDDQEVATLEREDGLASFDRVAAYADTAQSGFAATFDDIEVAGGDVFGGFPSPPPGP